MRKIVIFNSFYSPNILGGAERSVQMIAESLKSEGIDVTVVCTGDTDKVDFVNGVKVQYVHIPNLYWAFHAKSKPAILKAVWHVIDSCNIFARRKIRELIRAEKPDVVHTNNLTGFSPVVYSVVKSEGIPVVHTIRDYYFLCSRSTMFRNDRNCDGQCVSCKIYSTPKKALSRHVDAVVGVSEFILQKHLQYGYFSGANVKRRIFNIFQRSATNVTRPADQQLRFGFLGILAPAKGVEFVIQSFLKAKPADAVLHIYGKGHTEAYEAELKTKYASEHVLFLGFKQPGEIYPTLDVLIIPSLWHEPFPRTLIEAFSYGIPVIASKRGGIPEMIVSGENGFIFDPDDSESLTNLIKLAAHPDTDLQRIRGNATQSAREFEKDVILRQYLDVYRSVMKIM